MKPFLLAPLVAALVAGAAVRSSDSVNYDGFKVFRVNTKGQFRSVQEKLSTLSFEQWDFDPARHMDIVLAPEQLTAFKDLNLDYHCMHEDLGASIAAESVSKSIWKRQADDLSWYDNYHPYDDHRTYFEDLQASFPNNSEFVSSGTSYEGRDLYGLHLYGAGGPGKPAVLWHGTVHAREWITAMVCVVYPLFNRH